VSDDRGKMRSEAPPQETVLIIPARNEALSLPRVLAGVPAAIGRVIVVDNGSTDETGEVARSHGAEVIFESSPGYGSACLAGIAALADSPPRIVAFADGDGSDGVENLSTLLRPLLAGEADLALALRLPDVRQALSLPQRFGNRLAVFLIHLFWGVEYHDLGPMRAVSWEALKAMEMADRDFGWTVEMQIKAIRTKLRVVECPLPYHTRLAGRSKISRTLAGVLRAGAKILWVIGRELWRKEIKMNAAQKGGASLYGDPVPLAHPFAHKGAGK
jgi:glycosyltransferase involved in cell wall biosynthesis